MVGVLDLLGSPASTAAIAAALLWPPLTGFPTWYALSRGRITSTLVVSLGIGGFVFVLVRRLAAPALA